MSEADLQTSTRHLWRLQELIEDQQRRVALAEERGDAKAAHRDQSLLAVLEQCLESARYMLAHPHSRSMEE